MRNWLLNGLLLSSSTHSVSITWQYSVAGVNHFRVFRSTNGINYSRIVSDTTVLAYTDGNVLPNHKYWYQVRAYDSNTGLESKPSNTVTTTIP